MTTKKLSDSAKRRLFRQAQENIAALQKRLATCPIDSYDRVMAALKEEREALKAFI